METDSKESRVENYLSTMILNEAYSSKGNLKFKIEQLFNGVDFRGKNVLEIGGGFGVFCFYASIQGAKWVVNLEPECEGCKSGYIEKSRILREALNVNNVELIDSTIQKYNPVNRKFDIIFLYNSINHLDEKACIDLKTDANARETYKRIFSKIYSIANNNAQIILGDCSNINFFPMVGLNNPIYRTIEWYKHHSPNVWIKLLEECGFSNPVITWTPFNSFRKPGQILLGNKYTSFFLSSHFLLKMDKRI